MNVDKNFNILGVNVKNKKIINPLNEDVRFYGFNYINEEKVYYRLRKQTIKDLEQIRLPLANLAKNTSGGQLHFVTNSTSLSLRAHISGMAGISGMTFVAQGGFDCYVGKTYDDIKFYDSARFDISKREYEYTLFKDLDNDEKLVVINFPLYACVDDLELLIDDVSFIKKPIENLSDNLKITYYGTSITQGGCASRPGLCYTNVLTRRLKCEIINFGFSGNAFGDYEIAYEMSNITDSKMFIIDYEANGGTNGFLEKTLDKFYQIIRDKNPLTPIVVISRIPYLFDDLNSKTLGKRREEIRLIQENMVKKYRKNDLHLYYINGKKLFDKNYADYTVDSIHPNDLGFNVLATSLEKELKKILKKEEKIK